MPALITEKCDRLRILLTGTTADEFEDILRGLLQSDEPESVLAAILILKEAGPALAAPLVPDLAELLVSEAFVQASHLATTDDGHKPIGEAAIDAILKLGVPPPAATIARIVAYGRTFSMPEGVYDQGANIGDFATREVRPAAFAAQAAPMLGDEAFAIAANMVALISGPNRYDDWRISRPLTAIARAAVGKPAALTAPLRSALQALAADASAPPWRREHAVAWLKAAGMAG